ncbi:MAG: hypothetical protein GX075_03700 [Firmicutes bacterium]|nr:hypothetical protein [Bacillota bacterium]
MIASGFDFREERRQRFAIPEGAVLFIKRGDAVAALRLLKALNISGKPIGFELVNDGLRYGAFRLTATHSKAKTGRRGVIVVWSYAADGIVDEAAFEDFRKKAMGVAYEVNIAGPIVGVKVAGITGEMELKADIAAERRILRRGMKPGLEDSLLAVNGMEIGKRILEKLELIQGLKE